MRCLLTMLVVLMFADNLSDAKVFPERNRSVLNRKPNPRTKNLTESPPIAPPGLCRDGNCVGPSIEVYAPRTRTRARSTAPPATTPPSYATVRPSTQTVISRRVVAKQPTPAAPTVQSPGRQPSSNVKDLVAQIPHVVVSLRSPDGEIMDAVKIDLRQVVVEELAATQ